MTKIAIKCGVALGLLWLLEHRSDAAPIGDAWAWLKNLKWAPVSKPGGISISVECDPTEPGGCSGAAATGYSKF